MKRLIAILTLALTAVSLMGQEGSFVTKHGRMDRSKLNIGAYILQGNSRSEAHIKDVADCGIAFMMYMNNDTAALNLFSKYGVGAILVGTVPLWWGGFGDNAGTLQTQHPISEYEAGAAKFTDHPAIWGICIVDEPSCLDFPYIGEVTTRMEELFPNQFTHINLRPKAPWARHPIRIISTSIANTSPQISFLTISTIRTAEYSKTMQICG